MALPTTHLLLYAQVMAESADHCVQTILASCQSSRLVPLLTGAMMREKNAKIRAFLARYLLQASPCCLRLWCMGPSVAHTLLP